MPANVTPWLSDESGNVTAKESASRFDCPHCGARYKLVRVETEPVEASGTIACRACGGLIEGHADRHILKYFLVDRPRHGGRPRLVDAAPADRSSPDRSSSDPSSQEAQRRRLG
jgi:predicted RNA-binding Zn-ribbon protein involved in translation (DUF1610 family)